MKKSILMFVSLVLMFASAQYAYAALNWTADTAITFSTVTPAGGAVGCLIPTGATGTSFTLQNDTLAGDVTVHCTGIKLAPEPSFTCSNTTHIYTLALGSTYTASSDASACAVAVRSNKSASVTNTGLTVPVNVNRFAETLAPPVLVPVAADEEDSQIEDEGTVEELGSASLSEDSFEDRLNNELALGIQRIQVAVDDILASLLAKVNIAVVEIPDDEDLPEEEVHIITGKKNLAELTAVSLRMEFREADVVYRDNFDALRAATKEAVNDAEKEERRVQLREVRRSYVASRKILVRYRKQKIEDHKMKLQERLNRQKSS
jgi:hypothetical protein